VQVVLGAGETGPKLVAFRVFKFGDLLGCQLIGHVSPGGRVVGGSGSWFGSRVDRWIALSMLRFHVIATDGVG
jgi:hypothetical protein